MVPAFLLKRLYVKGSLRNTDAGFQFELKNSLGSGWGNEILPLSVDGEEMAKDSCFFVVDDNELCFSAVSKDQPFTLGMNKTITIVVRGTKLEEGAHRVNLGFVAQGLGKLGFEIIDRVTVP